LLASAAQVEDGQAPMSEHGLLAGRLPEPLIIGAAMNQSPLHSLCRSPKFIGAVAQTEHTCNTAHG
jgi:hypothetical protein